MNPFLFGYINPAISLFMNPAFNGGGTNSAGFMAGKNFGDGIQKGDWLGTLNGLAGLGMLFAGYSYQNSIYNSLGAAKSYLFQPLAFQPQWPVGTPTG